MTQLITRIKSSIMRKIYLIIGRGILEAINNDESKIQKIQVTGLSGETITDMERPQNYGLESYPDESEDFEVVYACIGGNRDQGVVLVVHRRDRPTLEKGEVSLYSKFGKDIVLTKDNTIKMADGSQAMLKGDAFMTEFDQLKAAVDQLKTDFAAWTPVPNDGGAVLKGIVSAGFGTKTTGSYGDVKSQVVLGE